MNRIIMLMLIVSSSLFAKDTLRVVVNPIEPFVIQSPDGELSGYDIDLVDALAKNLDMEVIYNKVDSFQDIFSTLDSGKADISVSAISITPERMEKYGFSYPYKNDGIGAMVRKEGEYSIWKSLSIAMGSDFASVWIAFGLFLVVASHIIWIVERGSDIITKDNRVDAFNDKYRYGIFDVLWFSIVTCSTVGYGDKVPKHPLTKVMTALLILVGVSFAGLAISQMSATIQIEKQRYTFNSLSDFKDKKVAYIEGTTSLDAVVSYKANGISVSNLDSAVVMLRNKDIDAIMFDEPVLRYVANKSDDLHVLDEVCQAQSYGILMPLKNNLTNRLNISILRLMKNKTIDGMDNQWFGK